MACLDLVFHIRSFSEERLNEDKLIVGDTVQCSRIAGLYREREDNANNMMDGTLLCVFNQPVRSFLRTNYLTHSTPLTCYYSYSTLIHPPPPLPMLTLAPAF